MCIRDSNDVDRLRPLYAAKSLFDAAVRSAGMTDESLVDPVVERVAKTHAIPTRTTAVRLAIADPKATLKKLNAIQLGDQDCLVQTMDRLEQDLATMVVRANAWADGNVDQLKALPFIDQKDVSYTHLDVYKRPVWVSCSMPRSAQRSHSGSIGRSVISGPTCSICTCPTRQRSGR